MSDKKTETEMHVYHIIIPWTVHVNASATCLLNLKYTT